MRCIESTENLAAYLHHELSSADDLAMQEHLAECAACRDEHAAMRDVMRRLQRVAPVEPSAQARSELHQSIDEAAGKPRLPAPSSGQNPKPSTKAFLPFRKLRELPAPPDNPPPAAPAQAVSALSPSARVIADRLEYLRHRKRNARIRRIAIYLFGLSLLAGGALAYRHPNWFSKPQHAPAPKPEEARATARWNVRHGAKIKGGTVETLINDQFELGEGLSAPLRVIKHIDPHSDEACLIAYSDATSKLLQADATLETAALAQEMADARDLFGVSGKPTIPAEWVDPVFGPERRAVILNFDDRIEIWSSTKLEKYLNRGPVYDFGL